MVSRVKALSIVLFSVTAFAPNYLLARQIQFSKEIPQSQIDTLQADLQRNISLMSDTTSLKVFGVNDFDDATLKKWLTDRVGYVISEKEDVEKRLYVMQKPYYYVNPTTFPTMERAKPKPTPTAQPTPVVVPSPVAQPTPITQPTAPQAPTPAPVPKPSPAPPGTSPVPAPTIPVATPAPSPTPVVSPSPSPTPKPEVITVMSNLGGYVYLIGKQNGFLVGYDFESATENAVVALRSPRVGIIQIGKGLFMIDLDRKNKASIVNSYYRLATLFHEAHHSDGNGKSLGFLHAVCPDGHDYENEFACDRNANGPYAVGGLFFKQVRTTCLADHTCTAREGELLAYAAMDSFSRIIDSRILDSDPE